MRRRPAVVPPSPVDLHPADKQHIHLSYILPFYFNKNTNATLIELLRKYESYPPDLLDQIQFVVVDDGSPFKFDIPDFNLNLTWLRIIDDIPWNLGGARNLGVVYAKSDKVVLADLDHEFPELTLRKLLQMRNTGRRIYRFYRFSEKYGRIVPTAHANSFLMSRGHFLRFYGYDEEFCGNYGLFGGWLTSFHRYHGSWVLKLPRKYHLIRHDLDPHEDHDLGRDPTHNSILYWRKRSEIHYWGAEAGHSRIFLNFRWEVVREYSRPRLPRATDLMWKRNKWMRSLFGYR